MRLDDFNVSSIKTANVVFEEMEKSEYQEKTPRIKGVHQLSTPYIPPPTI